MTEPNDPIYTSNGAAKSLTKREEFARSAMLGILSNDAMIDNTSDTSISWASITAVRFADALIAALNKESPNENS